MTAKAFLAYTRDLYDLKTDEDRFTVDTSTFLRRIRIATWRSCVLEFCKLFLDRWTEDFRYRELLQKILRTETDKERIFKYRRHLSSIDHSDTRDLVNRLETIRDKVIAHTDRDNSLAKDIRVQLKEMDKLYALSESILNDLYSDYLDATLDTNVSETDNVRKLLDLLFNEEMYKAEVEIRDKIMKHFDVEEESE